MTEVKVSKSINAPVHEIWAAISSFRGIENFSPIERSVVNGNGEGATRTCYMPDGAEIHEILSQVDDNNMQIEYKITEGPFPVEGYVSQVKVTAEGGQNCNVTWSSQFEVAEENKAAMSDLFGGFYTMIIDNLEKHYAMA